MARRKPNDRPRRASERQADTRASTRTVSTRAEPLRSAPRHVQVGRAKQAVRDTTPRVNDNIHRSSRKAALPQATAPDADLKTPGHLFSQPHKAATGPGATQVDRADTPLDQRKCKSRPSPGKGTGKGRSFVPWCK